MNEGVGKGMRGEERGNEMKSVRECMRSIYNNVSVWVVRHSHAGNMTVIVSLEPHYVTLL